MGKNKKTIKVLMVGGKRCGKTTVLASLNKESNNVFKGKMTMNAVDNNTGFALTDKIEEIEDYFVDAGPQDFFTPDDNPNFEEMKYEFALNITGMFSTGITVEFIDVPGEWFKLGNPNNNTVKEYIQSSNVLLIAIDTPYLFSKMGRKGYGEYHEQFNKPDKILHFFQNSVSVQVLRDRMVLFVPIKCERYYHLTYSPKLNINGRNYMQELFEAVCAGYAPLLRYFRAGDGLHNGMTLAVTPILSAGGIDFVKFGMKKDEQTQTEYMVSYYQEPEFLSDAEKGYNPKFCEQPLVYALAYVLKLELNRGAGNQKGWLQNTQNANLLTIQQVYETFRNRMIRSENGMMANNGFFMIQNPQNI